TLGPRLGKSLRLPSVLDPVINAAAQLMGPSPIGRGPQKTRRSIPRARAARVCQASLLMLVALRSGHQCVGHPSLERVEEIGTYSGLLVVARALILWRRDKQVIDVWDHPQPYISVSQRREFQGYLNSVKGQDIRVPFALQDQHRTMNTAVDVR